MVQFVESFRIRKKTFWKLPLLKKMNGNDFLFFLLTNSNLKGISNLKKEEISDWLIEWDSEVRIPWKLMFDGRIQDNNGKKIPQNVGSIYHSIRLSILNPVIFAVLFYSIFFFLQEWTKVFAFYWFFWEDLEKKITRG